MASPRFRSMRPGRPSSIRTTGSSLPAFGVGVYGIENGVRGVAGTKIINEFAANGGSSGVTRDLVQTGVGVQGVGDSAGVRGDSEDTGVRGKGGVGVFGEGGTASPGAASHRGLAAGDIAVRAEGDSSELLNGADRGSAEGLRSACSPAAKATVSASRAGHRTTGPACS